MRKRSLNNLPNSKKYIIFVLLKETSERSSAVRALALQEVAGSNPAIPLKMLGWRNW